MSLIESCIAVAILAAAVAVSTPSLLRQREIYQLHAAARMVESRLQSARIQALTRNRDCRINVTSAASYILECQGTTWETIETIVLPHGIKVTASARPEFHEHGTVAPAATITVTDSGGHRLQVIVNVNGRVRIQ